MLNDDGTWVQIKKVNVNEMDYGWWNEWNGLWAGGNKIKYEQ